jgi:hypothetical protein
MIALALLSAAYAGNVYINGVRADLLPEVTLTNATVRFDAQGNVWVDAPGYRVQVLPPVEYGASATPPVPSTPAASSSSVAQGQWWLVTQDDGSSGHTLEVIVNGTLVRRVASGQPQVILDVGPWLHSGANTVLVNALPSPSHGGGPLGVYIGRGSNLAGTIHLDNPDVKYSGLASDSTSGGARQFTLNVP